MLSLWIAGFVVGSFAARAWGGYAWIDSIPATSILMVALASFFVTRMIPRMNVPARSAWIGTAVSWAFLHAAPHPHSSLSSVRIAKAARADGARGALIVHDDVGKRFETMGSQNPGALGRVSFRAVARPFSRGFSTFSDSGKSVTLPTQLLDQSAFSLRALLEDRLRFAPKSMRPWLRAILIGDGTTLPRSLIEAFRDTGLLHLLVVSGSHITFFGCLVSYLLRLPGQLLYALRLMPGHAWRHYLACSHIVAAAIGAVYAATTGYSVPSQRAVLVFVVWELSRAFRGILPVTNCLLVAAWLQVLIYPLGFVSESSLMSWTAFLIVLGALSRSEEKPSWSERLKTLSSLQLRILAAAGAVFGNWSFMAIFANMLIAPFFPALLASGLAALAFPFTPGVDFVWLFHETMVAWVKDLAAQGVLLGGNLLASQRFGACGRLALIPVAVVFVLNACSKLSIRRYESA